MQDILNVLGSTRLVVDQAQQVKIRRDVIEKLCAGWSEEPFVVPAWDTTVHWGDGGERTANYILMLDSLNFCFWSEPGEPRWGITYDGQFYDGYKALAAGLKAAVESGIDLTDAKFLETISSECLDSILHPAGLTQGRIPLWEKRVEHVREVGRVLNQSYSGSFAELIRQCQGSAAAVADRLAREFSSFRDETVYNGKPVRILKRAQITVVDVWGALQGNPLVDFRDLYSLTAFADYKIPQVLRAQGILEYSDSLASRVDNRLELAPGSPEEVEIRCAMVWAVEWIRQELNSLDWPIEAYELDWFLWNVGQQVVPNEKPYHRTRTIFY
jgi:hypothetical protein